MDDKSVTPDPWAAIAAELHALADDAAKLVGHPAPCMFALNIQPYTPDPVNRADVKHRATTVDAVDAVAMALLGKEAKTHQLGGGNFHHGAYGMRSTIELRIYQAVADPAALDKDEEIARLRARLTELEAER